MFTPGWATTFWMLSLFFILGILGYLVYRLRSAQAEIDELAQRVEKTGHICHPPTWAGKGPDGWIRPDLLSSWECTCGTRYVLVRTYQPRHGGPFCLGWVTEAERSRGRAPSWVRQAPESRLDDVGGFHRRERLT